MTSGNFRFNKSVSVLKLAVKIWSSVPVRSERFQNTVRITISLILKATAIEDTKMAIAIKTV